MSANAFKYLSADDAYADLITDLAGLNDFEAEALMEWAASVPNSEFALALFVIRQGGDRAKRRLAEVGEWYVQHEWDALQARLFKGLAPSRKERDYHLTNFVTEWRERWELHRLMQMPIVTPPNPINQDNEE